MKDISLPTNCRGVYLISNIINGKSYVGSTVKNFAHRWSTHRTELRKKIHHSPILQAGWNFWGEQVFVFEILERCSPQDCIKNEQKWIDSMNPFYNVVKTAGSCLGHKLSDAHRLKISLSRRGKLASPETKRRMSESQKARNYKMTKEHVAKLIAGQKPFTAEHRAMISLRSKGRIPWNKGLKGIRTKKDIIHA